MTYTTPAQLIWLAGMNTRDASKLKSPGAGCRFLRGSKSDTSLLLSLVLRLAAFFSFPPRLYLEEWRVSLHAMSAIILKHVLVVLRLSLEALLRQIRAATCLATPAVVSFAAPPSCSSSLGTFIIQIERSICLTLSHKTIKSEKQHMTVVTIIVTQQQIQSP